MFQGSLEDLKKGKQPDILVKTGNNWLAQKLLTEKGYSPSVDGEFLVFRNLTDEQVPNVNRILTAGNIDVYRIEEQKKSLESIFLDMTGKESSL